jgi:hypothetical protein
MTRRLIERADQLAAQKHGRRSFLEGLVKIAASGGLSLAGGLVLPETAAAASQRAWRFCRKCNAMFFDGYPNKGRCPGGGGHSAQGFNFDLTYDIRETATAQSAWRYCQDCHAMFFDGYPDKGVCAAGGGHSAQGYVFVLRHDVAVNGLNQGAWRYCDRCHVMFFNGFPSKGRCAAGGGHRAQGYNFVLRYRGNLEDDVVLNPVDN